MRNGELLWLLLLISYWISPGKAFHTTSFGCSSSRFVLFHRMVTGNNRNVPETVKHSQVAKVEASLQSIRPLASSILAYFTTKSFVSAKLPNAYLTEPTEKFVQEQQKTKSIEAAGDKARQDFQQLLDKLTMTESSEELVSILSSMTNYLGKLGDMPRGLKKSEIVKACRLKKYDPASTKRKKRLQEIWTPAVESEYVKLILRIDTLLKPESASTLPI